MITVIKEPQLLSFSKNSIEFTVSSDMQYHTKRVLPTFTIKWLAKPTMGYHFNFGYVDPQTTELVLFHFVAAINYSEIIGGIPIASYPGTLSQYVDKFVEIISDIPAITAYYTIARTNNDVQLIAKEAREELIIRNVSTNNNSGSAQQFWSLLNFEGYKEPVEREGYALKAIVYFEEKMNSNEFKPVANLSLFSGTDGIAQLDVAKIIDTEMEVTMGELPVPYTEDSTLKMDVVSDKITKRFFVEFTETWNGFNGNNKTKSTILTVQWAGISMNDELINQPYEHLLNEMRFLTWWPSGKETFKQSKEYISVVDLGPETGSLTYFKVIVYTNLTQYTYQLPIGSTNQADNYFGKVSCYYVGYSQWYDAFGASFQPNEVITHWDVYTGAGNSVVISAYRFYLGNEQCFQKQLLFFNSFGVPETLNIVDWEETMDISKQLVVQSQQFNQSRLKPQNFIFDDSFINSIKIETVRLTQEEIYHLQSLLMSGICFAYDRGRYIPAVLQIDKKQVLVTSEFSMPINLELILANSNEKASFFKNKPIVTATIKCGKLTVSINSNGINYEDCNIIVHDFNGDNVAGIGVGNLTPGVNNYSWSNALPNEGNYIVYVEMYDFFGQLYTGQTRFKYAMPVIEFDYNNASATTAFNMESNTANDYLIIDWGIGSGSENIAISNLPGGTEVLKSITTSGIKKATFKKPCFDTITKLRNWNINWKNINLQQFKNLELLLIQYDDYQDKYYLNGLDKLSDIRFNASMMNGLEIGLKPNLTVLNIIGCSEFNTAAIDALIFEIWTLRDTFTNSSGISVHFAQLVDNSFSPESLEIINGTGAYVGQGLNSDYWMNITISQ